MVLLPTPLKAFTDVMPEIKAMLRACAFFTYGWKCDHAALGSIDLSKVATDPDYPQSWPTETRRSNPLGTVSITPAISRNVARRLDAIRHDLENAGNYYPKDQVRAI